MTKSERQLEPFAGPEEGHRRGAALGIVAQSASGHGRGGLQCDRPSALRRRVVRAGNDLAR